MTVDASERVKKGSSWDRAMGLMLTRLDPNTK